MTSIHIQIKAQEDLKKILKYSVEQCGLSVLKAITMIR